MSKFLIGLVLILSLSAFVSAQKVISKQSTAKTPTKTPVKTTPTVSAPTQTVANQSQSSGKSSAAFAELALRKAEVEADLKDLLQDYTEEYPEAKKRKTELSLLQKEMDKIAKADSKTVPKLSVAVGKLLVKKIEIAMELETLRLEYTEDYPLVQKTRRRLDSFDKEIKELLQ